MTYGGGTAGLNGCPLTVKVNTVPAPDTGRLISAVSQAGQRDSAGNPTGRRTGSRDVQLPVPPPVQNAIALGDLGQHPRRSAGVT